MTYSYRNCHKIKGNPARKISPKDRHGMDARVFINKDSPDYRPARGNAYTERQLRILSGEIPVSKLRLNDITILKRKAEAMGDCESCKIADELCRLKTQKDKGLLPEMSAEEALSILESLNHK